jgi:hypothetical protein
MAPVLMIIIIMDKISHIDYKIRNTPTSTNSYKERG